MKKNLLLTLLIFSLLNSPAIGQEKEKSGIKGSWELETYNDQPLYEGDFIFLASEEYIMYGFYMPNGKFENAGGGSYEMKGDTLEVVYDFNTDKPSIVGNPVKYTININKYFLKKHELELKGNGEDLVFKKMSRRSTPLSGAWRFSTRLDENGNPGKRRGNGPRQTIKILVGKRFQWAAFNNETKEFFGTGGGTFKARRGKYQENIEFFSRDDDRAGASLDFQYEIKGKDWFHTGTSSSGNKLGEVWRKLE